MVYTPPSDGSRWLGLAVLCWLLVTDAILLAWVSLKPVGWLSFLLLLVFVLTLPAIVHLTTRTWGAFNLEYWLDRNALRVRWAGTRQVIPLHSIRRIVEGVDEMSSRPSLLDWPSPFVRIVEGGQGKRLVRLASVPLDQCLLIETDGGIFAISPDDPVGFLEELQALNRLGLSRTLPLEREQPTNYYALATESDAGRWLLLGGLIGCLALFGYLMVLFPDLPEALVFHYNRQGVPDSVRPKNALFLLPVIGLLTYLTNTLAGLWMRLQGQHSGAYLFWTGSLLVQALSLLALLSLTT
ncbi:MAG: PH domain-containing protein [Caldilineaceae bacterium]|nr:PH domain-containing protein [Caldilineaceae bacterium]